MKCEKCGIEIAEGTMCQNCKNAESVVTETPVVVEPTPVVPEISQAPVEQIPEQYDPVANLMNEQTTQVVNHEKNEMENSIPLGDNNSIPQTPVNENVVNVAPVENMNTPENTQNVVQDVQPVTEQTQQVGEVPSMQNQNVQGEAPKKSKTLTIFLIVIGVVLAGVIIFVVLPMIIAMRNVNGMFDQAKANTFVTEVQQIMSESKTAFITSSIEHAAKSIAFTNINGAQTESENVGKIEGLEQTEKKYFVDFDRNGNFKRVVVFDENYCYDSKDYSGTSTEFDKSNVSIYDMHIAGKSDSANGCTGAKVEM